MYILLLYIFSLDWTDPWHHQISTSAATGIEARKYASSKPYSWAGVGSVDPKYDIGERSFKNAFLLNQKFWSANLFNQNLIILEKFIRMSAYTVYCSNSYQIEQRKHIIIFRALAPGKKTIYVWCSQYRSHGTTLDGNSDC